MRVIQLAAYSGPYSGSFVPMLRSSILAASGRAWDTRVVLAQSAAEYSWVHELTEIGVPITFLDPGSRRGLPGLIAGLIAPTGPTVLHSHFTRFDIGAVMAGSSYGAPVLWHIHSPQKPELAVRARNFIKYAVIGRKTFRILCVSPDIAEEVRRRGGAANRVEFFPNAIDTTRFQPFEPSERAAARAALALPSDVPIVLHFGWDWERKGGDVFLEMLARLRADAPHILGVTVGGGEPARHLAGRLGLSDSLRVLEPAPDVRRLYGAVDVFASPSRAEGMPFAVAEALCSGVPVVASDLPGHRAVAGEVAACRIGPPNPEMMAADVRALIGRPAEVARRESARARQSIVERLDLAAWAERLADLHAQAAGLG